MLPRLFAAVPCWLPTVLLAVASHTVIAAQPQVAPLATPGRSLHYQHTEVANLRSSVVRECRIQFGSTTTFGGRPVQWITLELTKAGGGQIRSWWQLDRWPSREQPATVARYLLQESTGPVVEYTDPTSGRAVVPTCVDWTRLLPATIQPGASLTQAESVPPRITLLGHTYELVGSTNAESKPVPAPEQVRRLSPNLLIGLPSNRKQKDETRRYDNSDYEYVRLTAADYRQMVDAGFTCLRVDKDQLDAVAGLDAFYWGVSTADLPFPECLYRSSYLGPALFLDEPAVTTRDSLIRPRLAKEPAFRESITPQAAVEALAQHFDHVLRDGASTLWRKGLTGRPDIDLGTIDWPQANLYTWETMIASGGFQLSRDPTVPSAIVFEPPGRIGSRRTIPEWNMSYGCQLRVDVPAHFTDVIFAFLRGAARATGKQWGTSIYGALDRADGPWFFTHAYDWGATRFFFWDNYQLACVPFGESLAIVRHLRNHAAHYPERDLDRLRCAAEVALVLPAGYNLGHVQMGKGNLWGIPELNLERTNRFGVQYRTVMGNLFTEIERCLRLGTAFDILWDLPALEPRGYREIVRIREDATLEIQHGASREQRQTPRIPQRPDGAPPALSVSLQNLRGPAPLDLAAEAQLTETSAPVFYTTGADSHGVYHNVRVSWDLYGPTDAEHRALITPDRNPERTRNGATDHVRVRTRLDRPGTYRLRAAASDLAGRTTVHWTTIVVEPGAASSRP